MHLQGRFGAGRPPSFAPAFQTLLGLDFVEGFPLATQRLAMYFLKLILNTIWHFRKIKRFERVDCTPQNAISLVEFNFRQTCSKKFEFWRSQLKLDKFKKHWSIGEAFCRVNRLDCLVFLSRDLPVLCSKLFNSLTQRVSPSLLDLENSEVAFVRPFSRDQVS